MEKVGNALISLIQDLSSISTNGHAYVEINENLCEPQRFKQLFDYFTQGTILERIDLEVYSTTTTVDCGCGYNEPVNGDHSGYVRCPDCGKFAEVQNHAYQIRKPDPSKVGKRQSIRF